MKKIVVLLVLCLTMSATPAWAICGALDHWIEDKAKSDSYPVKFAGNLLDGIHMFIEAPVELLYHPVDDFLIKRNFVTGLVTGIFEGLNRTVENIVLGAWNIVSSPIPFHNGVRGRHNHELIPGYPKSESS